MLKFIEFIFDKIREGGENAIHLIWVGVAYLGSRTIHNHKERIEECEDKLGKVNTTMAVFQEKFSSLEKNQEDMKGCLNDIKLFLMQDPRRRE